MLVLNPVRTKLVALRHPIPLPLRLSAVRAEPGRAVLRVSTVGMNPLLALCHTPFGLRPLRASLLMLGRAGVRALAIHLRLAALRRTVLRVMPVHAGLMARCAAVMLGADPRPLRLSRMLTRCALHMPLRTGLALHMRRSMASRVPLDGLPVRAAVAAMIRLGPVVPAAMIPMGPPAGRSCDRHRSHSCGEKQPGHHNFSFQR
jgi:hypothetical protein